MQKTRPIIPREYLTRLRSQSVAHIARSNASGLQAFRDGFYAPGGIAEQFGSGQFDHLYRIADTAASDETGRPQLIDHHAGNAWCGLWDFAERGYAPLHTPGDSRRRLCDMVASFPVAMRDRLDAVFVGLRGGVDPEGYYEQQFTDWEGAWYRSMGVVRDMSNVEPLPRRYHTRFRLYREAAAENCAELVDWFEDLRENVCGGGETAAWRWGDQSRASC